MKILIAEDNVDSRELLSDILMSLGHEIVVSYDGVNALEMVEQEGLPDLFILDLDMPRKNGFEVVEALKSDPTSASVPIIMLTARGDLESRVQGLALGADDYLAKPFSPRELIARVNTRLRAKAETDDLRAQREIIQRTFSRYVAKEIIDTMLDNPAAIQLGGQLRPVTVFFADLEGFTSISEYEDHVRMLNILNQYHGFIVGLIKSNGGTIDKFLGDGVMALFNAPIDLDDHVFRAVKTALEIKQGLAAFHKTMLPQYQLKVNVGIHTGQAVVGNVGASDIMDYTAVGDAVNLAARLQALSHGNEITISEAVYQRVQDRILAETIGERQIKGREEGVTVFRVKQFHPTYNAFH